MGTKLNIRLKLNVRVTCPVKVYVKKRIRITILCNGKLERVYEARYFA